MSGIHTHWCAPRRLPQPGPVPPWASGGWVCNTSQPPLAGTRARAVRRNEGHRMHSHCWWAGRGRVSGGGNMRRGVWPLQRRETHEWADLLAMVKAGHRGVCVCLCVCVRERERVCVCVCARVCRGRRFGGRPCARAHARTTTHEFGFVCVCARKHARARLAMRAHAHACARTPMHTYTCVGARAGARLCDCECAPARTGARARANLCCRAHTQSHVSV